MINSFFFLLFSIWTSHFLIFFLFSVKIFSFKISRSDNIQIILQRLRNQVFIYRLSNLILTLQLLYVVCFFIFLLYLLLFLLLTVYLYIFEKIKKRFLFNFFGFFLSSFFSFFFNNFNSNIFSFFPMNLISITFCNLISFDVKIFLKFLIWKPLVLRKIKYQR